MKESKISIHHIGARSGSIVFPQNPKFDNDIVQILYDADKNTVPQVEEIYKNKKPETHVLPFALWNKNENKEMNITYDPYASSFFELNEYFKSFYKSDPESNYDYVYGEVAKSMEKRKISTKKLDDILLKENTVKHIPLPDFISLDTESSEYEIIEGASEILNKNVLAIYSEVSFHEVRLGQKVFGDLCKLLSEKKFLFAGFDYSKKTGKHLLYEFSPFRKPIGFRGQGFHLHSEALFLRDITEVEKFSGDEYKKFINLSKLAFISIQFCQIEYALECLKRIDKLNIKDKIKDSSETYFKFLKEVKEYYFKQEYKLPVTFNEKFSYLDSQNRFKVNSDNKSLKGNIIQFIKKNKYLYNNIKNIYKNIKFYIEILDPKFIFNLNLSYNNFEKIFLKYGLVYQAQMLKKNRKKKMIFKEK